MELLRRARSNTEGIYFPPTKVTSIFKITELFRGVKAPQHDPIPLRSPNTPAINTPASPVAVGVPRPTERTSVISISGHEKIVLDVNHQALPTMTIPQDDLDIWSRLRDRLEDEIFQSLNVPSCQLEFCMVLERSQKVGPCILLTCWDDAACKDAQSTEKTRRKLQKKARNLQSLQQNPSFPCLVVMDKISLLGDLSRQERVGMILLYQQSFTGGPATCVGLTVTGSTHRQNLCTLGGLIQVGDRIYGLTTAHSLTSRRPSEGHREVDPVSDTSDSPVTDDDGSEASLFSGFNHNFLATQDGEHYSRTVSEAGSTGSSEPHHHTASSSHLWMSEGVVAAASELTDPAEDFEESDWALIEIADPSCLRTNLYKSPATGACVPINGASTSVPVPGSKVTVLPGNHPPMKGVVGQSNVRLQVQDLRLRATQIILSNSLARGTSGSWVVKDNLLLGMIVATREHVHLVYMIPVHLVFQSISRCFTGLDVSLPSDEFIGRYAASNETFTEPRRWPTTAQGRGPHDQFGVAPTAAKDLVSQKSKRLFTSDAEGSGYVYTRGQPSNHPSDSSMQMDISQRANLGDRKDSNNFASPASLVDKQQSPHLSRPGSIDSTGTPSVRLNLSGQPSPSKDPDQRRGSLDILPSTTKNSQLRFPDHTKIDVEAADNVLPQPQAGPVGYQKASPDIPAAAPLARRVISAADLYEVTWDGPDDPVNPKNWPQKVKWQVTTVLALYTFLSPFVSSMPAPALNIISGELEVTSPIARQMFLSIFVLAYAIGPMLLGVLSELYGRVPVLVVSLCFFTGFNAACGAVTNGEQLLAFRFLAGAAASAPLAIGGGVLGDTFRPEERARAMGIYAMGPVLGPALGPLIGAWISQKASWRWMFYVTSICSGLLVPAALIWQKESYGPVLLAKKAKRIRSNTGDARYQTSYEAFSQRPLWKLLGHHLRRAFGMLLTQPLLQLHGLCMMLSYGALYFLLSSAATMFQEEYHNSVGISGLHYISLGLGCFIGAPVMGKSGDKVYQRFKSRNPTGQGLPEYRMPVSTLGALLGAPMLALYGWSAQASWHWIVPDLGLFGFGFFLMGMFQAVTTYTVDAYTTFAASAIAGITLLRSIAGFAFPLFAPAFIHHNGYGISSTVVGLLAFLPATFIFSYIWVFGHKLRKRSSLTSKGPAPNPSQPGIESEEPEIPDDPPPMYLPPYSLTVPQY